MKKPRINFLVDIAAFAAFVFMAATGVLLVYTLPPGSGRWATVWGLSRHQWGDVHLWLAVIFLAIVALHVVLHWRWLASMMKGGAHQAPGWRLVLGLVSLLLIIALAVAPFVTGVDGGAVIEPRGPWGAR
ncbi:MAG: DUF4405 domain-containing protein [Gammaproteobacteria bacterium]|nr:DUF4405 domain-containing protein [Chromatiales bacterium]MDX5334003.1 DUF4405 domain-containing protein [Gammaproteobacteria bacterium]